MFTYWRQIRYVKTLRFGQVLECLPVLVQASVKFWATWRIFLTSDLMHHFLLRLVNIFFRHFVAHFPPQLQLLLFSLFWETGSTGRTACKHLKGVKYCWHQPVYFKSKFTLIFYMPLGENPPPTHTHTSCSINCPFKNPS